MAYKLFLSKEAKAPTVVVPWKWLLKAFAYPLLENHPFYRVTDSADNLILEREIVTLQ
jgi:hypothetical protein